METQKKIQLTNYLEYAEAAARTLDRVNERHDVGHMGIGVVGEFLELRKAIRNNDLVNIVEEIGDANWYLANHLSFYCSKDELIWKGLTTIYYAPAQITLLSIADEMDYLETKVERYTDVCKKLFAYGKYVDNYHNELKQLSLDLHKTYSSILLKSNTIPSECLDKNINKLYIRYPDKFDAFLAMNRNLVKEHDVLK